MKNLLLIQSKIRFIRKKKKTIGLCHGVFDVLHYGHIKHFEAAKKKCDYYLFLLHLINISTKVRVDQYIAMVSGSFF
jgi:glycerol-3-phosphate cytidylyltransferase-like family protein